MRKLIIILLKIAERKNSSDDYRESLDFNDCIAAVMQLAELYCAAYKNICVCISLMYCIYFILPYFNTVAWRCSSQGIGLEIYSSQFQSLAVQ